MGNKFIEVDTFQLLKIMDESSRDLVSKVMKRFEIHRDQITIKREVKELIHECFRDTRKQLRSYSDGRQSFKVEMIKS